MADDMKNKSEEYWRAKLTPEQYRVVREKGTEAPFTGEFVDNHEAGTYRCVACGAELFSSETKFESTLTGLAGWPAFFAEVDNGNIELVDDNTFGMHRTEITCGRCGAHLGHLFEGDPAAQGGKHYCVNSCSLAFAPKK